MNSPWPTMDHDNQRKKWGIKKVLESLAKNNKKKVLERPIGNHLIR